MKKSILFGAWCLSLAAGARAQETNTPALMPLPTSLVRHQGEFRGGGDFSVELNGYREPRLENARERFLAQLGRRTHLENFRRGGRDSARLVIQTLSTSASVQQLRENEAYRLDVAPSLITLTAPNPLGVLHGLQTLLELVEPVAGGFRVRALTINDQPRFAWRGLMIDSARHFQPVEVIKRNLDGMEAVKLNVFHWHLSDNQGFRVESLKFPLLQRDGSGGLFYTQAQVHEIIAYARERGIRVVPEFDMPGHTSAWFVGYPGLAAIPGPQAIERRWGVFDAAMDPSVETTFTFLDALIDEMSALFPDAYFHVGGDECTGVAWDQNASIQQFMTAHAIVGDQQLQAYFTNRVQALVVKHDKIPEGWDEVLQPNTPTDVVIQSWRGTAALAEAASRGYQGLLSNGYYLDLNFSAAEHYLVDPVGKEAASLPVQAQQRILGGEATMWSEFVDANNIDSRLWPRMAAIAERLWSPAQVRDVDSMYARLAVMSKRLEILGLKHNSNYLDTLASLVGSDHAAELKILGDVMQPPRNYIRGTLGAYTQESPLDHLVDGIHPESDVARAFARLAQRIAARRASVREVALAKAWLQTWVSNDARLAPLLANSGRTRELIPASAALRDTARIGLDALSFLQSHMAAPVDWHNKAMRFLSEAAQPQAAMIDMVNPAVVIMVKAAAVR